MRTQRCRSQARRRQSGAAAVEFGLVVLPLMLLLFGIIQYGFYFWSMQAGSAAVRDAARYAAVGSKTCPNELKAHVQSVIGPAGRDSDGDLKPDVTVTREFGTLDPVTGEFVGGPPTIGETVRVTIRFNSYYFGVVPVPDDAEVYQEADSRVENVTTVGGVCR